MNSRPGKTNRSTNNWPRRTRRRLPPLILCAVRTRPQVPHRHDRRGPWALRNLISPAGAAAVAVVAWLTLVGCASPNEDQSTRQDGVIVDGGRVGVNRLQTGDCFDDVDPSTLSDEFSEIEAVDAKPCTDAHTYEVYYLGALPDSDFPGEQAVNQQVDGQCLALFEPYVGIGYDASMFDYSFIFPSAESWADGDRGYICTLYSLAGDSLQGSMRGVGR